MAERAGSVSGVKGDDWTMAHSAYDERFPAGLRSGCAGTFRVESNDGKRPAVLVCDLCGQSIGVRQSTLTGEAPARPSEAMAF